MKPSQDLLDLFAGHLRRSFPLMVLSGAGCSTQSGLGDYRDKAGNWKRLQPITGQTFLRDTSARKRYWARSTVGWPAFAAAVPNDAHHALAQLETMGVAKSLVTQNVDGLHQAAGHQQVIDLHGRLSLVRCIDCKETVSRQHYQHCLLEANPSLATLSASLAPDGDADLEPQCPEQDFHWMEIPCCENCGGLLKPDVVFFGENVAPAVVHQAMDDLAQAQALLVAGSSLMVFSGYRFCKRAVELDIPVFIINIGQTRADDIATAKLQGELGYTLSELVARL